MLKSFRSISYLSAYGGKTVSNTGSESGSVAGKDRGPLMQARHKADYDIGEPFQPLDAAVGVARLALHL